jgi:hypothetical protein
MATGDEARDAKKSATFMSVIAAVIALCALVAGLTQHARIALFCMPLFLLTGVAANAMHLQAKKLSAAAQGKPDVGRQIGEGILFVLLLLIILPILFFVWWWYAMGQWHG